MVSNSSSLYIVEYSHAGSRWRTVVAALSLDEARRTFGRQHTHVAVRAVWEAFA